MCFKGQLFDEFVKLNKNLNIIILNDLLHIINYLYNKIIDVLT